MSRMPILRKQIAERRRVLGELLRRRGINTHLFTHLPNVRYLSGFTGSNGWVLISDGTGWFITDGRYRNQAAEEINGLEVRIASKTMHQELGVVLKGIKTSSLGVEAAHTSLELASLLRRQAQVRLRATRGLVEGLRQKKAASEVRHLRRAVRVAESAFLEVQKKIRPGVRECDIAISLESALKRGGAQRLPFDAIVASGPRGALPHARPGQRRLKRGDLVVIDWGAEYEGYFSDMTRTVCVGAAGREAKRIYDIVLRAQRAAVRAVRHGVPFREVDEAARSIIREAGWGDYFSHGTGHGVGVEIHEAPTVSSRARGVLEEGMVITVEPGIYVPGLGGVRIEDMVLVTASGSRTLTRLPRRLACVE